MTLVAGFIAASLLARLIVWGAVRLGVYMWIVAEAMAYLVMASLAALFIGTWWR